MWAVSTNMNMNMTMTQPKQTLRKINLSKCADLAPCQHNSSQQRINWIEICLHFDLNFMWFKICNIWLKSRTHHNTIGLFRLYGIANACQVVMCRTFEWCQINFTISIDIIDFTLYLWEWELTNDWMNIENKYSTPVWVPMLHYVHSMHTSFLHTSLVAKCIINVQFESSTIFGPDCIPSVWQTNSIFVVHCFDNVPQTPPDV